MKRYELYIHIPFCIKKCNYCDFLSFCSDEKLRSNYVLALCNEIKSIGMLYRAKLSSIFIGGGTPTILKAEELEIILDAVSSSFDIEKNAEISIEINPKTLDDNKLAFLRNSIVNRVSIGLQSIYDKYLLKLGRIHTYNDFLKTYESIRAIGIKNINIDLMYAYDGLTFEEWAKTLETIVKLKPEHISAYSLIVEEGTKFYEMFEQGTLKVPEEELERKMYNYTGEYLKTKGIIQYEISNYGKEGYECKHNIGYWTDESYFGVGLGSSSYINGVRYVNERDIYKYIEHSSNIKKIRKVTQEASKNRRLEETIFLGLRMTKGINIKQLNKEFSNPFENVYKEQVNKHIKNGFMEIVEGNLRLTSKGINVSNSIFSDFLID